MKLMSWGANTYGQLGQGLKSEQSVLPCEVKSDNIDLESVRCITGGGGHTLLINKDGQIFACGSNTKGQLGLKTSTEHLILEEIKLNSNHHITQISCGWDSSLAVTEGGLLLVWGSNAYGQLGIPKSKVPYSSVPLEIDGPPLLAVASGLRHSAFITKDGKVLVCGNGKKGQLGLIDNTGAPITQVDQPQEVPCLTNVCSVACGQHHTIIMTLSGRVYAWGDNKYGQLGLDPTLHPCVYTPTEISNFPQQFNSGCRLFSGWTHIAILAENGKVINWGRNTYGQLGSHEYQRPIPWKPQIMSNMEFVKQLTIGSEHNVAILDSGQLVSWGWNEHGNCGTGSQENVWVPTPIVNVSNRSAVLLGSGAGHSFALTGHISC